MSERDEKLRVLIEQVAQGDGAGVLGELSDAVDDCLFDARGHAVARASQQSLLNAKPLQRRRGFCSQSHF